MEVSVNFGRWTKTKAALAVAGALMIGGAVGSAVAISPTIAPPIKWQGGAEFIVQTFGNELKQVYTVPAGRNFILTDLMVTNFGEASMTFTLGTGLGGACTGGSVAARTTGVIVPAGSTTALSFQTGIGFASGQGICVAASATAQFGGRGFLFIAAPAS